MRAKCPLYNWRAGKGRSTFAWGPFSVTPFKLPCLTLLPNLLPQISFPTYFRPPRSFYSHHSHSIDPALNSAHATVQINIWRPVPVAQTHRFPTRPIDTITSILRSDGAAYPRNRDAIISTTSTTEQPNAHPILCLVHFQLRRHSTNQSHERQDAKPSRSHRTHDN